MKKDRCIAHVKKNTDGSFSKPHQLKDHLLGTSELTQNHLKEAGLEKLGKILGLTHDIGKASSAFQERIRIKSGFFDDEAHLEGKTAKHVDHSTAGAQYLLEKYGKHAGTLLAYIIAGHHSGLPDGNGESDSTLKRRLYKQINEYTEINEWLSVQLPAMIEPIDFLPKGKKKSLQLHFLIRILFSALTDADFLDTESYMDMENSNQRESNISLSELSEHYTNYLKNLTKNPKNPLNKKRNEVLANCLSAASGKKGLYSLTVPTGGGKTFSSMAFALQHAIKNNLGRVIYVIPYTSIIEQNADVFRKVFEAFGDNIILEHHSNLEPETETTFNRLAAQNWDAPIIVTTNVQFFESFYGNRSSACRKLHNVMNSVIVFDEAQMLPTEHLAPSLSVIRELVNNYQCSAVLCTATQPVLRKSELLKEGLEDITEIIPYPDKLYEDFRKVKIKYSSKKMDINSLAEKLSDNDQVLAIVNTRKEARLTAERLLEIKGGQGIFHLSTMMCPAHRSDTLIKIKQRLNEGDKCIVVSTQLIEAGVDLDFPVVYRAVAGIDSIAQAAGRCNREGKLQNGEVFVFDGENPPPPGHLRKSADSGKRILKEYQDDPLSLPAIKAYFQDFYSKEKYAHNFDKKNILQQCNSAPDAIPFKQIAKDFSLISEKTYSLIIPYTENGEKNIEELRKCYNGFVPRKLRKRLQRISIQLREKQIIAIGKVVEDVFKDGRFYVLLNPDIYSDFVGLKSERPEFLETESTII